MNRKFVPRYVSIRSALNGFIVDDGDTEKICLTLDEVLYEVKEAMNAPAETTPQQLNG